MEYVLKTTLVEIEERCEERAIYKKKVPCAIASYEEDDGEIQYMHIVNLTPHIIHLSTDLGFLTIPPSGIVGKAPECADTIVENGYGIPLLYKEYGKSKTYFTCNESVLFIGSLLYVRSIDQEERHNYVVPANFIRDADGRITGCRGLAFVAN